MNNLDTWSLRGPLPRVRDKVSFEGVLEDVNAALHTIPTGTITETNKLMYTTAVILERETSHNTNAPWLVDMWIHSNLPEQEPVTITVANIKITRSPISG